MKAADIERAVRDYLGEKLNLATDQGIFRGVLPPDRCDCVSVITEGIVSKTGPKMTQLNIHIRGRFESRDAAIEMAQAINDAMPYYGDDEIAAIVQTMDAQPFEDGWNGKRITAISSRCRVHVKC